MKPTAKILTAIKKGSRIVPVGDSGQSWQAYSRTSYSTDPGDRTFDLTAPDGGQWIVTIYSNGNKPFIHAA